MDCVNPYRTRRFAESRAGLKDIAPAAVAAVPIGLLFGAMAVAQGLSPAEATLMSVLVFAGGAQFVAIESWASPAPVAALVFGTLLINARHVLMGASLAPKMRASRTQNLLGFFFLTDELWALAERRSLDRPVTAAYWFAMAAVLPVAWIVSSDPRSIRMPSGKTVFTRRHTGTSNVVKASSSRYVGRFDSPAPRTRRAGRLSAMIVVISNGRSLADRSERINV